MPGLFEKQVITVEVESTPFAAKLLALRKAAGLSQGELADKSGIRRSTVTMWETGKSIPNAANLIDLCRALNTTPNDLLGFGG